MSYERAIKILRELYYEDFDITENMKEEIKQLIWDYDDTKKEMNENPIKIIEELEVDTDIEWWNENRKRINVIIRMFNEWQTKHRFDSYEKKVLEAHIKSLRRSHRENDGYHEFSDWQIDIIDEIENWVNNH